MTERTLFIKVYDATERLVWKGTQRTKGFPKGEPQRLDLSAIASDLPAGAYHYEVRFRRGRDGRVSVLACGVLQR